MVRQALVVSRRAIRLVMRARRVVVALVVGLTLTVSACGVGQPANTSPTATFIPPTATFISPTATSVPGRIDEFTVFPRGTSYDLRAITAGPDGNLWVTYSDSGENAGGQTGGVARVTPTGTVSRFPIFHPSGQPASPDSITTGPDGALWFTEAYAGKIGRVTPAGAITEFTPPVSGSKPYGITAGPDGALWFADPGASKIGRITPAGAITEFELATPCSSPYAITAGPDGALWFAQSWGGTVETQCGKVAIGRITTAGVVTEFQSAVIRGYERASSIAVGSDGNLWITEVVSNGAGAVVRMTPTGSLKAFPLCIELCSPTQITSGPDGALWFTEDGTDRIGRITPAGVITEFALPTSNSRPFAIAAGPGHALWFTELDAGKIGRITA